MRKVLIERPRYGSYRSYHAVRGRENRADDWGDLPTFQGMRRCHADRKSFSDLLGPLERYLWSCRGRRWDDVWSEISAQLSNNTVDSHLKHIHVPQFIETNPFVIDGKICYRKRFFGWRGYAEVDGLYVHPETGLVCLNEPERKPKAKVVRVDGFTYHEGDDGVLRPGSSYFQGTPSHSRKLVGFEKEAIYLDGIWYWIVFATVPPPSVDTSVTPIRMTNHPRFDIVTGKYVQVGRYRADKRQMGSSDLRRYGLINGR